MNDKCRAPGKNLIMAYENPDAYGRDTEDIVKTYGPTEEYNSILKVENKERLGSLMEMDGGESDDIHPVGWKSWTDKIEALGFLNGSLEYSDEACLAKKSWDMYQASMHGGPAYTFFTKSGKKMELPCQCARCLFKTAERANGKIFDNGKGKADPWALNRDSRGRLTQDNVKASEYQSLRSLGDHMVGFEQLDPLLEDVEYSRVAKPTPIHINIPDRRINEYMESRKKALENVEKKAIREHKEMLLVANGGKPSDTISVETLKWYKIWTKKENLAIKAAYHGLEWVEDGSLAIPDKMNEQKAKAFLWDIRTVDPVSAVAKHYVPLL